MASPIAVRIWSSFSVEPGAARRCSRSTSSASTAASLAAPPGEIDSAGFIGAAEGAKTSTVASAGATAIR